MQSPLPQGRKRKAEQQTAVLKEMMEASQRRHDERMAVLHNHQLQLLWVTIVEYGIVTSY